MRNEKSYTRRRLRGSYVISLMSIMLVLFVLSLFASLMLFSNNISSFIKENIGFEIFIKSGVKADDITKFQNELEKKEFVKSTNFISQEDATKRLSEDLGEDIDILELLGDVENPLLSSIDVRLKSEYANNDSIAKIEQWVKKNKIVDCVKYEKVMIDNIEKNISKVAAIILAIGIVLLIMSITLVAHTVRLSVYSKRFVVRSMQLVGATDGFIIKPFMKYFVLQGLLGAVLSLVLFSLFIFEVLNYVPEIGDLFNTGSILIIYALVLVLGVLMTTLSTFLSMKKYLRSDIDELYE